jgi:hypothetical protein
VAVTTYLIQNLGVGASSTLLPASSGPRQLSGWKWSTAEKPLTGTGGVYIVRLRIAGPVGVDQEFDGSVKAVAAAQAGAPVVNLVPISPFAVQIPAGHWVEINNDASSPGPIYAYVVLWT